MRVFVREEIKDRNKESTCKSETDKTECVKGCRKGKVTSQEVLAPLFSDPFSVVCLGLAPDKTEPEREASM